jgi:hypothetical protein
MSARERVIIVSVVHGMGKILRCTFSLSGHTTIFIKFYRSFELLGPKQLLPHNLYVCAHHLV